VRSGHRPRMKSAVSSPWPPSTATRWVVLTKTPRSVYRCPNLLAMTPSLATPLSPPLRSVEFEAKPIRLKGSPAARIDIGGELDTAVSRRREGSHHPHPRHPYPPQVSRLNGVAALRRC
jgi:hypothetical protein